jgi:serine/threonine protein kinase/tetratricopeptide (TPR) repeat protein
MRPSTAADLQALSGLIDEMLALPSAQRGAWLAALPVAHAGLAPLLAELLDDDAPPAAPDDPLARLPALIGQAVGADEPPGPWPGGRREVGPFELLRPLGQGGMGTVWLARRQDGAPQRTVALKLPLWRGEATPFFRRFERERDILAALEHPHIARLYEAGSTDDGQAWLAMEVVDGAPITQHCDQAGLSLRERVRLFLQVLDAVQFAHGRLVVHRDLKPSNIFVTSAGDVRLLDFGVAALLADPAQAPHEAATALTELGHAPMTPGYASPEQISHGTIGTASDIYSLGVVFYELMVGQRPCRPQRDTRAAMEEAILSLPPTRPSRTLDDSAAPARAAPAPQLRRLLRGDLDTIALKVLKKDPAERYASAEAFAEDLRHWLAGRPVRAHPDSLAYRMRKFVSRHRWPVAAGTTALLALVAALGLALQQARVAEREARSAQAVQAFLVSLFKAAEPAQAQGREPTVRDLMLQGEQNLRGQLRGEPALSLALHGVLVGVYYELGDADHALPLAEARLALALSSAGPDSLAHGDALQSLGVIQGALDRHEAALATLAQADRVLARHEDQRHLLRLSIPGLMAFSLSNLGRFAEARTTLEAVLPRLVAAHGEDSFEVLDARTHLALSHANAGDQAGARRIYEQLAPQLDKPHPEQGLNVAALRTNMGYMQWRAGRWADAAHLLSQAITEFDRLAGPRNLPALQAGSSLCATHVDAGHHGLAVDFCARNARRAEAFYGAGHADLAHFHAQQVIPRLLTGQAAPALALAQQALSVTAEPGTRTAAHRPVFRRRLALAQLFNGQAPAALAVLDELASRPEERGPRLDRHQAHVQLYRALALNALGRHAEAAAAAAASAAQFNPAEGSAPALMRAKALATEGLAWLSAKDLARASARLDQAARQRAEAQPEAHADGAWFDLARARLLAAQGQVDAASRLERQARERFAALSGGQLPATLLGVF